MLHFTFINLFNISSLFSSRIIIPSTLLRFSSGIQFYHHLTYCIWVTASALLFSKNCPALWTATFLEAVFTTIKPISNNYFLRFLANDKNPYLLIYFFVLGSMEYRRIANSKSMPFLFINKQCQINFIFYF